MQRTKFKTTQSLIKAYALKKLMRISLQKGNLTEKKNIDNIFWQTIEPYFSEKLK